MSTLQSINLKHPSSASNNIVLDSSGNATVANNVTVTGTGSVGGNLSFNSGYGSSAVAYGCRAWINFNGQTSTPTINGSGNVSSITDLGAGQYTINMTTAMPDSNYCVTYGMGDISGVGDEHALISIGSSSAFTIRTSLSGDSWADANPVFCAVHR